MTTWRDYSANPVENDGAPPVGAPEGMPTNQVNNVQREMMSVVRQLGDEKDAEIAGLGTMATQDADAVAITGGDVNATLSGPGAGITNLKSQNLIEGPIPKEIFPADPVPLDVKVARAGIADSIADMKGILPVGSVILWFGSTAGVPVGWQICDGSNGTPDLRGKFAKGATADPVGEAGGGLAGVSGAGGAHTHAGGDHVLTVAEMPLHGHPFRKFISGATTNAAGPQGGMQLTDNANMETAPAFTGAPSNAEGETIGGEGGGTAHSHSIDEAADHTHSVPALEPAFVSLWYIMRIT